MTFRLATISPTLGTDMAFATPALARLRVRQLERNFNGNLLPLDLDLLDELPEGGVRRAARHHASRPGRADVARLAAAVGRPPLRAHPRRHPEPSLRAVPEHPRTGPSKREGSYYTPTIIADLMVRATLQTIPVERRHQARFLDPAAGADVFLITAFRHLVAERLAPRRRQTEYRGPA